MKKMVAIVLAVAVMAFAAPVIMGADVKMGVAVGDQGLNSFYLSLGNYNRVQPQEISVVRQQGIPDQELPVVFFIASKAGVASSEIVKLRLKHWGWMKIAAKYRLDPSVFYVPVNGEVTGKVYGKIYGHYKGPQASWKRIKLSDEEVVNNVNLKFVSEYHGYAPEEVIKMREQGRDFVAINSQILSEKDDIMKHKKKKMFWEKEKKDERENHWKHFNNDDQNGNDDHHNRGNH